MLDKFISTLFNFHIVNLFISVSLSYIFVNNFGLRLAWFESGDQLDALWSFIAYLAILGGTVVPFSMFVFSVIYNGAVDSLENRDKHF